MKSISRTRRICLASGFALASVVAVPSVALVAAPTVAGADCYPNCPSTTVNGNSVVPPTSTDPVHTSASIANGSSSLPFTGADIGELAVVGAGAIVVGGVLARRRRQTS